MTTLLGGPQKSWNSRISVLGLGENMSGENLEIVTSLAGRDGVRILVLKGRLTVETVACFQDAIRREDAPELIIELHPSILPGSVQ